MRHVYFRVVGGPEVPERNGGIRADMGGRIRAIPHRWRGLRGSRTESPHERARISPRIGFGDIGMLQRQEIAPHLPSCPAGIYAGDITLILDLPRTCERTMCLRGKKDNKDMSP
jgi:hypothetical protein